MYEIYISRGFSDRDGATEFSLLQYYVTPLFCSKTVTFVSFQCRNKKC